MYVYTDSYDELAPWIQEEVRFERHLRRGDEGMAVRRVQEWLSLHGFRLAVDGDFGPVTMRGVTAFQDANGLLTTGEVDEDTFTALVAPMAAVLFQRLDASESVGAAVVDYANAHLAQHPREVGGANRGPWVRLYMKGNDGPTWLWCAGFVSFVLDQAAESLQTEAVVDGSFSCDVLASQGRRAGALVGEDVAGPATLPPGSIFLNRRTSTDWTHTGFVIDAHPDAITTIEGNTNDDGLREGVEVCARTRGYASKDFIQIW